MQGIVPKQAFEFPLVEDAATVIVERALCVANRFRTRDRALHVLELCDDGSASPCRLFIADAQGRTLAEADSRRVPRNAPVVLAPETSFYLAAQIPQGGCFLQRATVAEVHPLLIDLGTWLGGEPWRPSTGPRTYVANLRFKVGPSRRRSARAIQILDLAAEGLTDKSIAERLGIGISTVETHWRILRERGGFASRTEAVANHLRTKAERTREDLEAERDRLAAQAWLRDQPSCQTNPPLKIRGEMRSWPIA